MTKNIYCLIPARSGSKRIKNKNILKFYGISFLGRTISTAKKSKIFKKVIVSSDSNKILKIGSKHGAINFGLREKEFADDKTTTDNLLLREIKRCNLNNIKYFCCIYPATPMLDFKILKKAYKRFIYGKFDSLISITKFEYPIFRALKANKGKIEFMWKKFENKRSQDIKEMYHDIGYFYFFKTKSFLKNKKIISKNTGYYEISRDKAIDIDDKTDLKIAKKLFKN